MQGKKQAALQLCRETARTAADAEEVVQVCEMWSDMLERACSDR